MNFEIFSSYQVSVSAQIGCCWRRGRDECLEITTPYAHRHTPPHRPLPHHTHLPLALVSKSQVNDLSVNEKANALEFTHS